MKQFNNFRRRLLSVAAMAAVIAAALAGCTKVDDTLGGNLIPDNQQMKAGFISLGKQVNPKKYVETRLFQTDSIIGSNISYGYFGTQLNDTIGERKAGFLSQMINYYKVDSGYFGYKPIFDSAQIMLKISKLGSDSLTEQTFAIYEVISNDYIAKKPVAAGKSQQDTTFYINFDPEKPNDDPSQKVYDKTQKLFTFTLGGKDKSPSTTSAVTLKPTDEGRDYIKRLMLQKEGEKYYNDYSIYSPDSLKYWIEEFKGLYICPDPDTPLTKANSGTIFATSLEYSGLAVYGRNRLKDDPSLIKDTIGMVYYFYESGTEFGNVSVNTVSHNYNNLVIDIEQARESNTDRLTDPRVIVEGLGGVVTEMTFRPEFFAELEAKISDENQKEGKDFKTLAFSQVRMSVYFSDSDYDWEQLTDNDKMMRMTREMNAFPNYLGMYTNFKTLTPISDYAYAYEKQYETTLPYGGKINRSRGCYVMDITGYMQQLWNSYIKAKENAGGVVADIDWEKVTNRKVYIGPEAYSLYTSSFGVLQGMEDAGNDAPIRFDMAYNLIK